MMSDRPPDAAPEPEPFRHSSLLTPHSSLLIPAIAGIGNALMAQPMVRVLARHHEVHVVGRFAAINACFAGCGVASSAVVDVRPARLHQTASTMRGFRADAVVLPFPANRWQYQVLARLALPRRIVVHRYPIGRWAALGVLPSERIDAVPGLHDVDQNNRLLGAFGLEPDGGPPRFHLTDADHAAADALLEAAGVDPRPDGFTVVHAGCGDTVLAKAKRWPPARFAELAANLRDRGHRVVLWEGPDERGVADQILQNLPETADFPVLRLAGPLGHAAAVLARARLYVGTDSGPGHLAAAVGTPPVTIFGIADPDRVCPFGYRDLVVTPPPGTPGFPDAPYPMAATRPKKRYTAPLPVGAIRVEDVLAKVEQACRAGA